MKVTRSKLLQILIIVALLVSPLAMFPTSTNAVSLTKLKDTLEDSRPSLDSNHEIMFVTASGVQVNETIIIEFDTTGTAFDLTSVAFGDIDLAEDDDAACNGTWTDKTLAATATSSEWGVAVNTTDDKITFTAPSSGTPITAGRCVQIQIGDNAGGSNEINNPATQGTYYIDFTGTFDDTGDAAVAIVDTITAQVTVDETLTFTVAAVTDENCTDRSNKGTEITTTATSVNFATPTVETFVDACQSLTVTTNAGDGYSVTVRESDQLTSAGADTIADGNCDGSCSDTLSDLWATNTNNGFAYCLENKTGTDAVGTSGELCNDGTPEFKTLPSKADTESPEQIMTNAGPVSGNEIHFGYRISVSGTQQAGVYTNNVIFVATPTY